MDESAWLRCTKRPDMMLAEQRYCAGPRKLRLTACGIARLVWDALPEQRIRDLVALSERFADGQVSRDDLEQARIAVSWRDGERVCPCCVWDYTARQPDISAVKFTITGVTRLITRSDPSAYEPTVRRICDLVREIYGNPYQRRTPVPPAVFVHSDGAIPELARSIYHDRLPNGTFDLQRMALLADALEDAGCNDMDLLSHLRSPGMHVQGCWAVDRLLKMPR